MKESELRIGNLITAFFTGEKTTDEMIVKVNELCSTGSLEYEIGASPIEQEDINKEIEFYDGYKPIPLTKELLVNFSFKEVKARPGIQKAYRKGGTRIEISNSGNFYWKSKPVPYVHLLQNVYYFNELKDEELKLV